MRSITRAFIALMLLVGLSASVAGQAFAQSATPASGDAGTVTGAEPQLESSGSFTVAMSDSGSVPDGLTWTLYAVPVDWSNPVATDAVPDGPGPVSVSIPVTVPYGVYQLWVTGDGYSSGQTVNVDGPTFSLGFVLDRIEPTATPTPEPTQTPTDEPTLTPTIEPTATATLAPNTAIGSLTVAMSDGGDVPAGLTWSLQGDTPQSGPVPSGPGPVAISIPDAVPYGSYALWITGEGYSSGQAINVAGPSFHHDFVLTRLTGTLTIAVTTSDGADVPAGTTWSLDVAAVGGASPAYNGAQSGTLASALPSGGTLPIANPVEYGTYTLTIDAPGYKPYSTTINHTDPWNPNTSVTAALEALSSEITLSVRMADDGPIPAGLTWTLFPDGSWTPLQTGSVTSGGLTWSTTLDPVPYGVYGAWITGAGYSSGQALNVQSETASHEFVLDRLSGTITVDVTTSNGADIPAGTTWSLDVAGVSASADAFTPQSGTITTAMPSGSALPLTNPIEYGTYSLTIDAPGYAPYTTTIDHTDPWNPDTSVTAELQFLETEVSLSVAMSDGGAIPPGLTWTLYPAGSWEPLQSGEVTPGDTSFAVTLPEKVPYGTYQLWITGSGYSSGQVIVADAPTLHHDFVLERLIGSITVAITTSDGSDIPAGAEWQLSSPTLELVDGGTVATPFASGGTLVSIPGLEYGTYLFEMHAPGYEAIARSIEHTDPWNADTVVTFELVLIPTPTPTPGGTVQPTATAPTATITATTPAPSATATATGTPSVSSLPNTGQGGDAGMNGPAILLALALGMALLAIVVRLRPARRG
ncbi:MAG: hypothetical protein ACTHMX_08505 [Thermomicrobiales bacterium]